MNDNRIANIVSSISFANIDKAIDVLNEYFKLIDDLKRQKQTHPTHVHHIIPKAWGGTNDPNNLIELSVANHIKVHQLLAESNDRSMCYAYRRLASYAEDESTRQACIQAANVSVVNLNTGQTFSSVSAAESAYNKVGLYDCITKQYKFAGYYQQFKTIVDNSSIELQLQQIKNNKKAIKQNACRSVINLTTGEAFNSVTAAAIKINTDRDQLIQAIRNKRSIRQQQFEYKNVVDHFGIDYCKQQYNKRIQKRRIIDLESSITYESSVAAANALNVSPATVYNDIVDHRRCKQRYLAFVDQLIDNDVNKTLAEFKRIIAERKVNHYQNISNTTSNKVLCIETNKIFETAKHAAANYNVSTAAIYQSINKATAVQRRFHFRYLK